MKYERYCYGCKRNTPHVRGMNRDGDRIETCERCGKANVIWTADRLVGQMLRKRGAYAR